MPKKVQQTANQEDSNGFFFAVSILQKLTAGKNTRCRSGMDVIFVERRTESIRAGDLRQRGENQSDAAVRPP